MFLLPLVSTLTSSIFSGTMIARYLGHRGCIIISIFCLFVSFLSSILIWIEVCLGSSETYIDLFGPWFTVGSFNVSWTVYIDLYTAHMLLTVTSVSTAVHCYAVVYMRSDPHLNLFLSYLSLFTFFMLVLVCSESLINMLVGWEGIGVCSYLLIGYYGHRLAAVKSAQKAILVNRVSDGLLLWGIMMIWWNTGSLEYDCILLNEAPYMSSFLSLAIMIGAMGKSAQILFHVWLADAMEGYKAALVDHTMVGVKNNVIFNGALIASLNTYNRSSKEVSKRVFNTFVHSYCSTSIASSQSDFPYAYAYGSTEYSILLGLLLGDGHLQLFSRKTASYSTDVKTQLAKLQSSFA